NDNGGGVATAAVCFAGRPGSACDAQREAHRGTQPEEVDYLGDAARVLDPEPPGGGSQCGSRARRGARLGDHLGPVVGEDAAGQDAPVIAAAALEPQLGVRRYSDAAVVPLGPGEANAGLALRAGVALGAGLTLGAGIARRAGVALGARVALGSRVA